MTPSRRWERLGRVFRAQGQRPWMMTHTQMPQAEVIEGSLVRIYFTCRDGANRSHVAWLTLDLERPDEVVDLATEPLLAPGPLGAFDDAGIMSSCLTVHDGRRRFYNIGWNVRTTVFMHVSIGLATGPAGGEPLIDDRLTGPVLERNPANPYYVSCPFVLRDGEAWRMWYMSGLEWLVRDGEPATRYDIRHARSPDGVTWTPDAATCVGLEHPGELAIASPRVVRDPDRWRMWYCWRGETFGYRIGFAESRDGETWRRSDDDALTLLPSGGGFDSAMTCYPDILDHGGERWMFYCGDGFGQGGLGLARLTGGTP